jgi:UDP-2,4-diacetamido-2,4,6-trideoxy-beta-L-altropyranose hydrolase
MRCLALAEAWQDTGGETFFISACEAPAIEDRLKKEGMPVLHIRHEAGSFGDADETVRIALEHGADWIVVDGYHFGAEYQKTIKDAGLSLLFIDDYGHADHYYADIVLNQNIYADLSLYKKYEPYTRFLLGMKYVLLRREFLKYSDWHRDIPKVARKILVTLGGSDPDNVTLKVIEAVKTVGLDGLEVKVVVGGANPHFDLIHEMVKDLSNFTLIKNADNMPELMAWADVGLSAGGSTCWELAFMGLPSILYPIAENQKIITQELYKICAAVELPSGILTSVNDFTFFTESFLKKKKLRSGMSLTQKKLVEGTGAKHIVSIMMRNT